MTTAQSYNIGSGSVSETILSGAELAAHQALIGVPDPDFGAPDPILDGLTLIDEMTSVIDFGQDEALTEFASVFQAQIALLRMLRGG